MESSSFRCPDTGISTTTPQKDVYRSLSFEVTSSANWRGYTAEWSISRGRLHLLSIEGQIDGKKVRDRQIIKRRFPVHAKWFTGKIFVAVGDFDNDEHAFDFVIEFTIEDGNVRSTSFHETLKIPLTWNGMPYARPPAGNGTESSDARETSSSSVLESESIPRSP
jgi:hypothetical protein